MVLGCHPLAWHLQAWVLRCRRPRCPSDAFTTMTWASAIWLWTFWPAHKLHQARCWSKKVNVRCQASLADSSWYELRASQWKPWLASG